MKITFRRKSKNNKGLATIEALPLLVLFVVLFSYGVGYFAAIHTAILQNIAARTYAFETFRNRSNLMYFRNNLNTGGSATGDQHYLKKGFRFHGIRDAIDAQVGDAEFIPTKRKIAFASKEKTINENNAQYHNDTVINKFSEKTE